MASQPKEAIPLLKKTDICADRAGHVIYAVWHNADATWLVLCNLKEEQQEWTWLAMGLQKHYTNTHTLT